MGWLSRLLQAWQSFFCWTMEAKTTATNGPSASPHQASRVHFRFISFQLQVSAALTNLSSCPVGRQKLTASNCDYLQDAHQTCQVGSVGRPAAGCRCLASWLGIHLEYLECSPCATQEAPARQAQLGCFASVAQSGPSPGTANCATSTPAHLCSPLPPGLPNRLAPPLQQVVSFPSSSACLRNSMCSVCILLDNQIDLMVSHVPIWTGASRPSCMLHTYNKYYKCQYTSTSLP